jgi:hypothetical protein
VSSRAAAQYACSAFVAIKRRTLKRVAGEQLTKREAIEKLRRTFLSAQSRFLRLEGSIYSDWLETAQLEWDEVLAAAADDAIWDRLVDRCCEPQP